MDLIRRLEPLWLLLVVVGALNWGIIGLFDENFLANVFGTGDFLDVLYVVIGVAALTFIGKLLDELMHMGDYFRGDYTRAHHA
jgi:uncharacterized membrane protein YuzA (DUF378 family)